MLEDLQGFQRDQATGFCLANRVLCDARESARNEQSQAIVAGTADLIALIITVADVFPGDEAIPLAAGPSIVQRLSAAGNRLQSLLRRGPDTRNPLAAMQGLADQTSSLFRKNPQLWWNQLSPAEKAADAADPQRWGAGAYGNAMQRFVNRLADVAHPGQIQNLGGPNRPDYAGQGSWAGATSSSSRPRRPSPPMRRARMARSSTTSRMLGRWTSSSTSPQAATGEAMTHSRVIDGVRMPAARIAPGSLVEGYVVRNCQLDGAIMSVTLDPKRRATVRHVRIEDCHVGRGEVCGAILDEVTIENLANGDVLFIRGAAFRHVVLRGRFDRVSIVSDVAPGIISDRRQRAFEAANRRFYDEVDWALDIREAAFREISIDGVPAHLLRLDPESQAVVSREEAARGAWRAVDLAGTWWHITLEELAVGRDSHAVLVVPTRNPAADQFHAALARLRAAGIATDPPPRAAGQSVSSPGLPGWLSRVLGRRGR